MTGRALRRGVLALALLVIAAPVLAGLALTLRAAFGVLPAIGADTPGLAPFRALLADPAFPGALRLTLVTGLGSTALALMLSAGLAVALAGRVRRGWLLPVLAAPHAAVAIGLAFVLAPSGWIARGLAMVIGWGRPPEWAVVNDPAGLGLLLALVVKEVPFLTLMILAALTRLPVATQMAAGRALGHPPGAVWARVIAPQVWPMIRLPVLAVLAYGLSVVDMALVLGPSQPPTLAVWIARAQADPDLARWLPAAAGAVVQVLVVAGAVLAVLGLEALLLRLGPGWATRGPGGRAEGAALVLAAWAGRGVVALGFLALAALAVWSVAWRWPWPLLLPADWSGAAWARPGDWGGALAASLLLAGASTLAALALAVAWLESGDRGGRHGESVMRVLVALPLLVPQLGFLAGLYAVSLRLGVAGGWLAVIWGHALFVFPYVMLVLAGPWAALDRRQVAAAAALGAGPWRRLVRVKLPLLLAPLAAAVATGIAVSVAQYLPTLFLGAGRIATLTTEAVTLSSGSDRRVTAVYAALQALVPLAAWGAALAWPALAHRHRAGLRGAA